MAEAGTIFKQAIAAREDERAQEALLQRTMYTQMQQNARDQKTRDFTRLTKVTDSIVTAMDNAATPGMKTILRKRFSGLIASVGRQDPMIGQALAARYPLDIRRMRIDEFMSRTPPPTQQFIGQTPSDNYYAFASDLVNRKKYGRLLAKQVDDQETDIVGFFQLDEKIGVNITDNNGKFQLVNIEVENQNPKNKELAEKFGTTVSYLLEHNFELPPESQVVSVGNEQVMVNRYLNAKTGRVRIEQQILGDRPGAGYGAGGKQKMPLPQPQIMDAIASIEMGGTDSKDPVTQKLFHTVTELMDQFQDDPARFATELNRELRLVDDRFTYLVDSPSDRLPFSKKLFSRDLKLNENTRIRFVRGNKKVLQTADGVHVGVIYDPVSNNLANSLGEPITDETFENLTARIQGSTAAELGLTPKPKPASIKSKEGTQSTEDLIKGLPSDVKEWDVQTINERGKRKHYLIAKQEDGTTKPVLLSPAQYEVFIRHSKGTDIGQAISILQELYNKLPKESKIERPKK